MKLLILRTAFFLVMAGMIMSCSNDDLGKLITHPEIAGVWKLQEMHYDVQTTGAGASGAFALTHSGNAEIHGLKLDMKSDPATFTASGFFYVEVPSSTDGEHYKELFPFVNINKNGTWAKDDEMVYLTFRDLPTVDGEIIEFSNKALVISFQMTVADEIEGQSGQHVIKGVYTFTK